MNDICEACGGKCCQGIIEVYSQDEIYYDESLVCEDPICHFDRIIQTVNMQCIALKDGKCSIYEKRPLVCREYAVGNQRCENIRHGKIHGHGDGFNVIADALNKAKKV